MTLCFFLKFLGEFSFYFFIANVAGALIGSTLSSLAPLMLLCVLGTLAFVLYRRASQFSFVPLLPLPLCFLFAPGAVQALMILLPCIYLVALCRKQAFFVDHAHQQDRFFSLLKTMAATLPFVITMASFGNQPPLLLPLFLLFLFSNIFLLRMLRHTPENLEQLRFKTVNTLEICLFLALIFLISTPFAVNLAITFVSWLFQLIVTPILTLFVYIAMAVVWAIDFAVGGFQPSSQPASENPILNLEDPTLPLNTAPKGIDPALAQAIQGVFILALLTAAFFFFRRLLTKNHSTPPQQQGQVTRSSLYKGGSAPHAPADRFPPREPRAAVRYYYRRFLRLCRDIGFSLPSSSNSAQVVSLMEPALPKEELSQLRQVYIKARYSQQTISKEEAQQAKNLYQQMRSASKGNG